MSRIIPALILISFASLTVVAFLPWLTIEGELTNQQRFLWQIGFAAIGLGSLVGAGCVFLELHRQRKQ
jgi:hypothetical protein